MRTIIRNIVFYSFSLFALTQIISGVKITGGIETFVLGGAVLSIMFLIIKPVLDLIALPFNLLTLGTFSFLSNTVILYLLTLFVPEIKVTSFLFKGFSYSGFIIPRTEVNQVFALIVSGLTLSAIITFLTWLIRK
ncbi:MAG: hypothetical protein A2958_03080 [Candidatus Levybacteria bacterium RIFCSPLOWO2_01_FULL_38_13]|nr:MAG: hypothetical protein A2629_03495 [Candidatus Levybacteria bacterium RIFCSPHIGHO2_01_FULL_41_15]OGH35305.1 MAG: hypothetical protein A2958_03080 [Candidatus Levybacteria bacterium RIFCSPLOWO2_01_FULL_38_13]